MKTKALVVLALSLGLVAAAYAAPAVAPAKIGKTTVGDFAVRVAAAFGTASIAAFVAWMLLSDRQYEDMKRMLPP